MLDGSECATYEHIECRKHWQVELLNAKSIKASTTRYSLLQSHQLREKFASWPERIGVGVNSVLVGIISDLSLGPYRSLCAR